MSAFSEIPIQTVRRATTKYLEEDGNFPKRIVIEKHLLNVLKDTVVETIKMITSEAVSSGRAKFLRSQDIIAAADRLGFTSYAKVVSSRINKIQKTRKAAVDDRTGALRRSRKKRRKSCQQLTEAELLELSAEQDNLLSRAKEAFFPSGSTVLDLKTEV